MSIRSPERPLARGRTADVYAWKDGYVVKLFHPWVDQARIEQEARVARAVHQSGLRVPAVGDVVHVNGRTGLVYECRRGASMLEDLQRRPWRLLGFARRLAQLHADLHSVRPGADFPAQRALLEEKIRAAALPADLRARITVALASMPDGGHVCHGDFHPGNVLLTDQGEAIIDWVDASCGNPIADVARTTIVMLGAAQSDWLLSYRTKPFIRLFHYVYLRHYFRYRPEKRKEYEHWLPILAAARLSDGIPGLEKWLIAQALRCRSFPGGLRHS